MRVLSALFAVLFLAATVVQFNDPDWPRWVAIYLAATILSAASAWRPVAPSRLLMLGVIALVWAVILLPGIFRAGDFSGTEIEREFFGLAIIAGWMLFMGVNTLRSESR